MKKHRSHIYHSRQHLYITLLTVIVPFLYLLLFSQFAQIAASTLFYDIGTSVWRLLIAYIISAVCAWAMAVAFFRGKRALVALPVFDVLQSFPTFAALPLAIYFWGPSNFTTIFFLIFTIIWPIFFAILSSLKLMKHEWDEVAEIYGLTGKEYLKKFLIPVSVPGLITGSIVGLGEAWEAVVATEIIVGMQSGLGPFFQSFAANSGVTVFGILGFLILIFSINKIIWIPLLDWSHSFIEE
jgi:ABC-type nitrate/sulfonate/bicarbonate transport system permease component